MTWVAPHTWVDGETITTGKFNAELRENMADLYALLGYRTVKTNWRPYLTSTAVAANTPWTWTGGGTAPDSDTVPPNGWFLLCWSVEWKTSTVSQSINHHVSAYTDPVVFGDVLDAGGDYLHLYRTNPVAAHWVTANNLVAFRNPSANPVTITVAIQGWAAWATTVDYNSRISGGTTPIIREIAVYR